MSQYFEFDVYVSQVANDEVEGRKQKKGKEKTEKEATTTAENATIFSYTLALALKWKNFNFAWAVVEKGYDKSNPGQEYEISYSKIKSAASLIKNHILETPCYKNRILAERGFNIYLKRELYQITDSIKARGVVYTLLQLSDEYQRKGVITISTGSFAFILCHYGRKFKIPVTIVMPASTAEEKVKMCQQDSQIKLFIHGRNMLEAHEIALRIAKTKGLFYIDGNDHPNMIIGQATFGLEIMQQEPKIDAVLLPTTMDGCGVAIGIAMAIKGLKSKVKIIEVQSTDVDSLFEHVRRQTNIINELAIPPKHYTACPLRDLPRCVIDRFISIQKPWFHVATEYLHESEGFFDIYGAIGLAAFLSGQLDDLKGKRVIIPLLGKMDSIKDLMLDRQTSESHAGPSTSRE